MAGGRKVAAHRTYLDFVIRERGFETDFSEGDDIPDEVRDLKERFEEDRFRALYDISFSSAEDWYSPSLRFLHKIAFNISFYISRVPDIEVLRDGVDYPEPDQIKTAVPFIPGSENVNETWIRKLTKRMVDWFREDIASFDGTVELYYSEKGGDLHAPGRIFFHLITVSEAEYPFAFMATYSPESKDGKRMPHVPLKYAIDEYRDDNRKMISLLSNLAKVTERSELISEFVDSGELFHPLGLGPEEAYRFLTEVPVYEECGILCRIPNWWKNRPGAKIDIKLSPTGVTMSKDAILSCVPEMSVDGEPLTREEIEQLLAMSEGLAFLKGKWIEVNHERLKELLERCDSIQELYGDGVDFASALKMCAGVSTEEDDLYQGVSNSEWLGSVIQKEIDSVEPLDVPGTFNGKLRDYQETGFNWLNSLYQLGFGACLADDMGLGKTVQVLTFLEAHPSPTPSILVVPTSLLGNWVRESSKFVPRLRVEVISSKPTVIPVADLIVTTYGLVSRHPLLRDCQWHCVILDEAQAIKNSETKQSAAAKELKGRFKLALTGTPMENRLEDLWSIFDFINPGLLGDSQEFARFVDRLQDSEGGYTRLREMISPFILRRLKTDKSIIKDLPNKIEVDEYVTLSKKQTVIYRKYLRDVADKFENSPPEAHMGLILVALTKFKQICNHPDQFLGTGEYEKADSGKFQMLEQICGSIHEKREKVLVFTQYREMLDPISDLLTQVFGRKGLTFHGGMSSKERDAVVRKFNSEDEYVPYLVLSLKAGGVGLNLTSANHVIHFDRWWNPAVENQATDRAFRIGQTKEVVVHRFICAGTMEEKIDELIKSKIQLADDVLGKNESWIADMDKDSLMNLFRMDVRCRRMICTRSSRPAGTSQTTGGGSHGTGTWRAMRITATACQEASRTCATGRLST